MKKYLPKFILFISMLLFSVISFAQSGDSDIDMADEMRGSGKIYVVIAVLLIIFTGLIIYLIFIDRKLSRIERRMQIKSK